MRLNSIGYILILLVMTGCGDTRERAIKDIESEAISGAKSEIEHTMLSTEIGRAAQEGSDCGAYYAEYWGESISSLVHDNFQHVDDYRKCDVYLEKVETSWGSLHRALFFIDRQLVAMEMIAVSNSVSQGDEASWLKFYATITRSCFDQYGDPIELDGILAWIWAPNTGELTTSYIMKGPDNKSIRLLVKNSDKDSGISVFNKYQAAGHISELKTYLGI